jgi:hypothetical protein
MSAAEAPAAEGDEDMFNFKDAKDVFLGHKQLISDMVLVENQLYTAAQDGKRASRKQNVKFYKFIYFFNFYFHYLNRSNYCV